MHDIIIKEVDINAPEYPQVWELREAILRKPLGLSLRNEDLSRDADDSIIIALNEGKVIGCVMLKPKENNIVKLRAMAVYEQWQHKQVGSMLVQAAEQIAFAKGFKRIVLNARQVAIGFYQKLGYTITSDVFTEVGIPHVVMEKQIEAVGPDC